MVSLREVLARPRADDPFRGVQALLGKQRGRPLAFILSILIPFHDPFHDLEKNSELNESKCGHSPIARNACQRGVWPRESKWCPNEGKRP